LGRNIEPGRIFGEIALFSPTKRRTATALCVTDCTVLTITEETVHQLYYQDPAFSISLVELIVHRLSNDIDRADSRLSSFVNSRQPEQPEQP
jgi:CRP-like cAMP-binding protein